MPDSHPKYLLPLWQRKWEARSSKWVPTCTWQGIIWVWVQFCRCALVPGFTNCNCIADWAMGTEESIAKCFLERQSYKHRSKKCCWEVRRLFRQERVNYHSLLQTHQSCCYLLHRDNIWYHLHIWTHLQWLWRWATSSWTVEARTAKHWHAPRELTNSVA